MHWKYIYLFYIPTYLVPNSWVVHNQEIKPHLCIIKICKPRLLKPKHQALLLNILMQPATGSSQKAHPIPVFRSLKGLPKDGVSHGARRECYKTGISLSHSWKTAQKKQPPSSWFSLCPFPVLPLTRGRPPASVFKSKEESTIENYLLHYHNVSQPWQL